MSVQTPYLEVDALGSLPAYLLVVVFILAILGVVAHAAFA